MKRHLTVSLAMLLFFGCTKAQGPGAPEAQAIAKAVCPKAYSCCTPMQLEPNDLAGTDEASCESKTTVGFEKNFDGLRSSLEHGRAAYHADKLEACLAFIRGATCAELNRTNHFSGITGCEPWVEALVPPGGGCDNDIECIDGFCDTKLPGGPSCHQLPHAGEPCVQDRCARNLLCDGSKTCVAQPAERVMCVAGECDGGPCGPGDAGPQTCVQTPIGQCFYASSCAYGSAPLSSGVVAAALALLALATRLRRQRTRR
jgi:hypothetical protein